MLCQTQRHTCPRCMNSKTPNTRRADNAKPGEIFLPGESKQQQVKQNERQRSKRVKDPT